MTHRTFVALLAGSLSTVGCKQSESNSQSEPAPRQVKDPTPPEQTRVAARLDIANIERVLARRGMLDQQSGVFRVQDPRWDLTVTVGELVKMTPPQGLTSWVAFQKADDHAMVMGDIVLTEDQVNPVMDAVLGAGLQVTALHNHFLWEKPRLMFMHIGGMADEESLATSVRKVFASIDETRGNKGEPPPKVDVDPAKTQLDTTTLDEIFGQRGAYQDGVYKVTFGRTTKMGDVEIGSAMGVNTWAAFAGTDDVAVVDGDFAMLESELQTVLRTLRRAMIDIVAIHQHMIGEQPRIMFLHFWGAGNAKDLARGIKAAIDTQGK